MEAQGINGIMCLEFPRTDTPFECQETHQAIKTLQYHDLPAEFFNHELEQLHKGKDDKILDISEQYGILFSPLSYEAHKLFRDLVIFTYDPDYQHAHAVARNIYEAAVQALFAKAGTEEHGNYDELEFNVFNGFRKSYLLAKSLLDSRYPLRGLVVSFEEIRATASMLLLVRDLIAGIAMQHSLMQLWNNCFFEPKRIFEFLHTCMLQVSPTVRFSLVDNTGTYPKKYVGQDFMEPSRIGTLTEAVAVQLYNAAISDCSWRYCEHCGIIYQLKRGEGTKGRIRTADAKYCSSYCQKNAKAKRHREKRKAEREQANKTDTGSN
jgi:hypothetical protein